MAKFNTKKCNNVKVASYEGGVVFRKSLEDEWANMLFSSVMQNQYYESAEEQQARFITLTSQMISKHGPELIGKCAVFARNELGMRSISELVAALLNEYKWDGKRKFYANYFRRPDGVGEVFAAIDALDGKRSHALIRGCSDYLSSLSAYTLAKYPLRYRKYTMRDIINLTHPKSEVIDLFQRGELPAPDTWEVKVKSAKSLEQNESAWRDLVEGQKLGYLALLRNLSAMCKCSFADRLWVNKYLVPQITNLPAIKNSLVWPFQIYTSWKFLHKQGISLSIEDALATAFEYSTQNMPKLSGETLIVLDVSASMDSPFSSNSLLSILEVCAAYASAFLNSSFQDSVDFIKFGSNAKQFERSKFKCNNVFKQIDKLAANDSCGYSTDISTVFDILDKHYDRIILFSDMQVMGNRVSWNCTKPAYKLFKQYCNDFGPSHIYSFDLGNYSSQIVSGSSNISYITALNDTVFKIIEMQESGRSLLDIVRDYEV